jgi:hypothetical protein
LDFFKPLTELGKRPEVVFAFFKIGGGGGYFPLLLDAVPRGHSDAFPSEEKHIGIK